VGYSARPAPDFERFAKSHTDWATKRSTLSALGELETTRWRGPFREAWFIPTKGHVEAGAGCCGVPARALPPPGGHHKIQQRYDRDDIRRRRDSIAAVFPARRSGKQSLRGVKGEINPDRGPDED